MIIYLHFKEGFISLIKFQYIFIKYVIIIIKYSNNLICKYLIEYLRFIHNTVYYSTFYNIYNN